MLGTQQLTSATLPINLVTIATVTDQGNVLQMYQMIQTMDQAPTIKSIQMSSSMCALTSTKTRPLENSADIQPYYLRGQMKL